MNYFITGTDTGAGKTFVTSLIVRSLRKAGLDSVAMKPICCGDREDAEKLHAASGGVVDINDINPVWFRTPAAPYTAAGIENRMVDLDLIREKFSMLKQRFPSVLVEGVGGWMVPIQKNYFVADLARDFGMPVAVVVHNRLGALNHTLLTVQSIKAYGLECAGLILNHIGEDHNPIAASTNRAILEEVAEIPVLFEVNNGQTRLDIAVS